MPGRADTMGRSELLLPKDWTSKQNFSATCPRVHQAQHRLPSKGGAGAVVGLPWALCAVSGATIEKECKAVREHPKKGDQNDGKPQGQDLRGAADVTCFVHLGKEVAEGHLYAVYNFPNDGRVRPGTNLLSLVTSNRTWANQMKLHQWNFRWDLRKRFFTETIVGYRSSLPGEVVRVPTLPDLEKHLDKAFRHIV